MYTTRIGASKPDSINIYGYDLCSEVIGHANLADLVFLGAQGRLPSENESKMLNALMVGIAEHGFTPSSLATRLTWLGAPEAPQAAVAAGLLGAGSVYLGAMEYTAEMLQAAVAAAPDGQSREVTAAGILDAYEKSGDRVPGFGHPVHRPRDPRTARFFELAQQLGFLGEHSLLLQAVHEEMERRRGKPITLNGAGAFGAVLVDLGFDGKQVRTVVTAARAVGLVGHIAEESAKGTADSTAQALFQHVEHNTDYRPER
ncbi:citryl-CoA lyase [Streptomyces sp. NPDC056938]|uniref:citryl-CoA lyase n=1 Tax=unclassified Streptomyces TaxID=2593676 RepID=UPI00362ECD8E